MNYYDGVSLQVQLDEFRQQYLERRGWPRSFEERVPRDNNGPIPWITYPALTFLETIVRPQWRVFEYGCGNSSLWWARRVSEVHTVDHSQQWVDLITEAAPPNCHVYHVPEGASDISPAEKLIMRYEREIREPQPPTNETFRRNAGLITASFHAYAGALGRFPSETFDVVVIDGMARSLCTWVAVHWAAPKQCVVFDNSDRCEYTPAYEILRANGYRRIDFWGPGPINPYEWCTSIFLRDLSILP